jgi:hypothetical protein
MVTPPRRLVPPIALGLAAILLAACSAAGSPSASSDRPSPSSQQVPIVSPSTGNQGGSVPDEILQAAIADAAQETGADPSTITVVSAEATTWNNGALGCPKPGEMYTQALVPGYRIVLEAGGRELDYHASESGTVKLCEGVLGS